MNDLSKLEHMNADELSNIYISEGMPFVSLYLPGKLGSIFESAIDRDIKILETIKARLALYETNLCGYGEKQLIS